MIIENYTGTCNINIKKLEEEIHKSEGSSYEDLLLENTRLVKKNESLEEQNKILTKKLSDFNDKKYIGKIIRLSKNNDYGFIKEKSLGTIFFHVKNTDKLSLKNEYIDMYVDFNVVKSNKGYDAINVEIIE